MPFEDQHNLPCLELLGNSTNPVKTLLYLRIIDLPTIHDVRLTEYSSRKTPSLDVCRVHANATCARSINTAALSGTSADSSVLRDREKEEAEDTAK